MIYSVILKNGLTVTMDEEELEAYNKRLKKEEEERSKSSESPTKPKAKTSKKTEVYRKIKASSKKPDYRYTRKVKAYYKSVYRKTKPIIILEGPYRYWIYDEDAIKLASIYQFELFKTKKGYTLVYDKSLHDDIIDSLKQQGLKCVIVHPETITRVLTQPRVGSTQIEEGKVFVLKDSKEHTCQYIIKSIAGKITVIHHSNGTTELITTPELGDSRYPDATVISHRTPLAASLLGKHVGETVFIDNEPNTIVEIG